MDRKLSTQILAEMKLFAAFSAAEQRFIRRSLDVGLGRGKANLWARGPQELREIEAQKRRYRSLELIGACIPDDIDPEGTEPFIAPLINVAAADLAEGKLEDFEAFRFLYERLMGPRIRPWLLSAFCAAAALPAVHPDQRRNLLQSIPVQDAIAAGWSVRPSLFYPEWVDKVAEAVS
ncbi:hypothetical protein LZ518_12240 [Sphingomonas sp. RB56-2]|uniref:Uncharacterized protein n=1 Tax=Sphingomonas brevis TaxID=2908206 RepID=A0ABT0SC10_9SPHN|nr:hypothetical protein [Sphingomonas brevis]MCL6741897.1 hypothetical protein [Sphingomonas brevis]